jgi:hypothetical protein
MQAPYQPTASCEASFETIQFERLKHRMLVQSRRARRWSSRTVATLGRAEVTFTA